MSFHINHLSPNRISEITGVFRTLGILTQKKVLKLIIYSILPEAIEA